LSQEKEGKGGGGEGRERTKDGIKVIKDSHAEGRRSEGERELPSTENYKNFKTEEKRESGHQNRGAVLTAWKERSTDERIKGGCKSGKENFCGMKKLRFSITSKRRGGI